MCRLLAQADATIRQQEAASCEVLRQRIADAEAVEGAAAARKRQAEQVCTAVRSQSLSIILGSCMLSLTAAHACCPMQHAFCAFLREGCSFPGGPKPSVTARHQAKVCRFAVNKTSMHVLLSAGAGLATTMDLRLALGHSGIRRVAFLIFILSAAAACVLQAAAAAAAAQQRAAEQRACQSWELAELREARAAAQADAALAAEARAAADRAIEAAEAHGARLRLDAERLAVEEAELDELRHSIQALSEVRPGL